MTTLIHECQSFRPSSNVSHSGLQTLSDHAALLEKTFAIAAKIAKSCATHAPKIDHHGAFPIEEFKLIANAGLLATPLMPQWGGLGLGFDSSLTYELLLLLRLMGWGNLAVGRIFEGHVNALQLIQTFGSYEQIEQYAEDARDRYKIFGVWNAEANDGVKVIPLNHQTYQLQGSKTFCSGAGYVERPFVNGKLNGQWQICIVPMEQVRASPDASWWQPSGMKATASYRIDFSGVELEARSLLGKPEDYNRQPWLSGGAIRFAAVQLGGAESLLDATHQYLQELGRTEDASQSARMGQMAIAIESGKLWLKGASDLIAAYDPVFGGLPNQPNLSHESPESLINYVNMARTAIEQICMNVIQLCERSVGTRGLMPPYPMERIIRDLTLYLRQPGFDATLHSVGHSALSNSNPISSIWYEASRI
jgi:alkylation response protein AidB-like acyl-CoA dehydrogenase